MGNLSQNARNKMRELHQFTAQAYGAQIGEQYTATPTIAQTLNEKIVQDGGPFLQQINTVAVPQVSGAIITMGVSGTVSGRTDTSGEGERAARRVGSLEDNAYTLKKVDSDVAISYEDIDAWAEFPNFRDMYGMVVRKAVANDRLLIGWRGTSAAATTNRTNNPLLQDVGIGWLQKIRTWNSGSQYQIGTVQDPIEWGSPALPNLDVVVFEARQMLDIQFRNDQDLVALISADLMNLEEVAYYKEHGRRPTEKFELLGGMVTTKYGGVPAFTPPFFPDKTVLVTSLKNLSIYYQSTSWRRIQKDHPEKDQYEDFNSRNEGYVIQEFRKSALIENITEYVAPEGP